MKTIAKLIGIFALLSLLAACGGGSGNASFTSGGGGGGTTTPTTAKYLSLSTSQISVKSDNSNSATITAIVLDVNNAVVSGANISFAATAGQLSAASGVSDSNGNVSITFSSGTTDPSNTTATITATVVGTSLSSQIPVQIVGSTLTVSASSTNLVVGGTPGQDTSTITVTAKNAGNVATNNAAITLTTTLSSTGAATITPLTGNTGVTGTFNATLVATSVGTLTVTAAGLGTTATQTFTITGTASAFKITTPATTPSTLSINAPQQIVVNAPGVTTVRFTTSLGTWSGCSCQVKDVAVSSGTATDTLTSTTSGTASVQVSDAANSATFDTRTIIISAPSSAANHIVLQANVTTLAPSSGSNTNSATLTATVYTASNQPVSNAPVAFSLSNTTGGGETVSPVYGNTGDGVNGTLGQVTATFSSGTLSSSASGVHVTATVYDVSSTPIGSSSVNIVINQTAGSVVIGQATTVQNSSNTAYYILPMSVLVADSGGNAVPNAVVTLSLWPEQYSTGYWKGTSGANCGAVITATFQNEDVNENLQLDPGEDIPYSVTAPRNYLLTETSPGSKIYSEDLDGTGTLDNPNANGVNEDLAGDLVANPSASPRLFTTDGMLTPLNSTAGSLPTTVTTDASGVANFNLTYLKQYAVWINDRVRAKVLVQGTETTGVLHVRPPVLKSDADTCLVFNSPFNPQ